MKVKFEITHLYDEDFNLYPVEKKIVIITDMSADDFFEIALKSHMHETKKYSIETSDSCCKRGVRTFEGCRASINSKEQQKAYMEEKMWEELYAPSEDEPWWNR